MATPTPQRRTLSKPAEFRGKGLFSGVPARLLVQPSLPGKGVRFRRLDSHAHAGQIPAHVRHLSTQPMHTCMPDGLAPRNSTLATSDGAFATIEHVLSALAGLGITDALLELAGPEVPILDGSARPFVEGLLGAGLAPLDAPPGAITLPRPVEVRDERGGFVRATPRPSPGFGATYELDFGPGSPLPASRASWDGTPDDYISSVAPARTFCLEGEALAMRRAGLFPHLTPADMLVIGADSRPIDNALRFPDEPARHKLLDLIGDLSLLGAPLQGDVHASRSGHALTHALVRAILDG